MVAARIPAGTRAEARLPAPRFPPADVPWQLRFFSHRLSPTRAAASKRQHHLMMPRDRVSGAARRGVRPLHHVHARAVVLQEIEIRGGEAGQRMPQVAHRGYRLQKHLRQHHRRAHIQVDAAVVQSGTQRAKQAEIAMRGAADGGRVGRRVRVRRVRADGHVHRHRRARAGSAWSSRLRSAKRRSAINSSHASKRFAHAETFAVAARNGPVHLAAGLFGRRRSARRAARPPHPRWSGRPARFRNRGSPPRRSLRTPSRSRARIRSTSTGASPHLITWPPRPQMMARRRARACHDGVHHRAKRIAGQNARQRIEPSGQARPCRSTAARNPRPSPCRRAPAARPCASPSKSSGRLAYRLMPLVPLPSTLRSASAV